MTSSQRLGDAAAWNSNILPPDQNSDRHLSGVVACVYPSSSHQPKLFVRNTIISFSMPSSLFQSS